MPSDPDPLVQIHELRQVRETKGYRVFELGKVGAEWPDVMITVYVTKRADLPPGAGLRVALGVLPPARPAGRMVELRD